MTRSVLCQLAAKADACRYRMAVEPRSVRERAWWLWAQTYSTIGEVRGHASDRCSLPRFQECVAAR